MVCQPSWNIVLWRESECHVTLCLPWPVIRQTLPLQRKRSTDEEVLSFEKMRDMDNNDCPRFTAWSGDGKRIALTYGRFNETEIIKGVVRAIHDSDLNCG